QTHPTLHAGNDEVSLPNRHKPSFPIHSSPPSHPLSPQTNTLAPGCKRSRNTSPLGRNRIPATVGTGGEVPLWYKARGITFCRHATRTAGNDKLNPYILMRGQGGLYFDS